MLNIWHHCVSGSIMRMPKPFQVEALASSQWELTSDRLEWRMKLPVIATYDCQGTIMKFVIIIGAGLGAVIVIFVGHSRCEY